MKKVSKSIYMIIEIYIITYLTIYNHLSKPLEHIGIYFESSNNQKFFSYQKNHQFIHDKVEDFKYIIPEKGSKVLYNSTLPNFINTKIKHESFSIKNHVIENLDKLEFFSNLIIKPIYISNNAILN